METRGRVGKPDRRARETECRERVMVESEGKGVYRESEWLNRRCETLGSYWFKPLNKTRFSVSRVMHVYTNIFLLGKTHVCSARWRKGQTNSIMKISSYSLKLDFCIVELQNRGISLFSLRKRANECLISHKRVFAHFVPKYCIHPKLSSNVPRSDKYTQRWCQTQIGAHPKEQTSQVRSPMHLKMLKHDTYWSRPIF